MMVPFLHVLSRSALHPWNASPWSRVSGSSPGQNYKLEAVMVMVMIMSMTDLIISCILPSRNNSTSDLHRPPHAHALTTQSIIDHPEIKILYSKPHSENWAAMPLEL